MKLVNIVEESKWMRYRISTGDEVVKINLSKELLIDEDRITKEVMEHPRIFGYLTRVHKFLVKEAKNADLKRKKVRAIVLEKLVEEGNAVTRAREIIDRDPRYLKAAKGAIEAEYKMDTLAGILEAFKHRKDLIQTLSATLRSER